MDDFDMMAPAAPAAPDPMSFMGGGEVSPPLGTGSPGAGGGYVDPFQGMPSGGSVPEMNASALREWEDKHEKELEEMARKEAAEKESRRSGAAGELSKWKNDRTETAQKRMATNRTNEKAAEQAKADALKPGANPWERVVALIDTSAKTVEDSRDTSRMRTLLIQLKSNPVMPATAA
eukprot:TRINITY_DN42_c1_g1_i1.p1 TRINITY_DN42_c1_g1~~TRINITY_DN42_c1_g1_i1.p1  ORF type:complete len:177 (+),score=45.62 TRINITY_DN42_c1_g1_i1:93-623(+)